MSLMYWIKIFFKHVYQFMIFLILILIISIWIFEKMKIPVNIFDMLNNTGDFHESTSL